ncbi:multiple organellar RNA editing factor 2, chloroplastic-like [Dendrobium catenatum]|uniref:DAG protein, chloroplastic n=1 Tax=Dendrobium catenatum TaxID=906689 RepID=A0A2I0VFD0_9ASPA|nr:multiple organellar RNA editing factor 2, chloroplastic-like [Dendrobium catenatum]PKU62129.1 DAG protein, chloroplastic [Dendrobium catenatum]
MAASAFAGRSFRSTLNRVLSKRLFHYPVPSSRHPIRLVSPLVGDVDVIRRRPMPYAAVRLAAGAGGGGGSPINSGFGGGCSGNPPTEKGPLFSGCDYEHWFIVMDNLGLENATKEQLIDCFIKTLAKVVGSEEEATKKIYSVSFRRFFCFGCEIDEETSDKLVGLPGVFFVLPDSYVDAENQDYGGELFVNGQIVKRSPERQEALSQRLQRAQNRPTYDKPRYTSKEG